jgi:phospholipase C
MSHDTSASAAFDEELDSSTPADRHGAGRDEAGERGPRHGLRTAAAVTTAAVVAAAIGVGAYLGTQTGTPAVTHHAMGLAAAADGTGYEVYIAAAGGGEIASLDSLTGTAGSTFSTDTAMGVALAPNDQTLYVANTGEYGVLAYDLTTKKSTTIHVGAYPQDVVVSPDGSTVYATVTGGDTGVGGSNTVAVIDTATDTVIKSITVGASPRRIVLSADGSRAYVGTAQGVYVIDTAADRVIGVVRAPSDVQGLALSPDGTTLYATAPDEGRVLAISTRHLTVQRSFAAGAEPWSVGVTPDGKTLYVTDTNSNSVAVLDAADGRTVATVAVGSLPTALGITPDGSEVWVGNTLTGSLSVISTATNTLAATIPGGPGTSALDSAPTEIVFGPAD